MNDVTENTTRESGTWLDRLIFAVSPSWGSRRIAARRVWASAEARHDRFARIEAAESSETRGDRWLISRLSVDSQLEQDIETTRERSRDIYQNDVMGGAVDSKVNHVIGVGHTPQGRIKERDGVVTASEADTYNDQLEDLYERWAPQADRSGRRSVWMLSRLAGRHNEFDGESFTILSDSGRGDKPIPLSLQVIDPERVNTPTEYAGDSRVRLGIRYGANDEVIGYYVQRSHPGDSKDLDLSYDFIEPERMLHVFEQWFAGQSRGLPWMVRALNRARDAKDVDEAAILGAQVEQCYAAWIRSESTTGYEGAVGAANGSSGGRRMQDITPGTVSYLDPGEEIQFGSPSRPGSNFAPFMEWNYRRVAAAINWPFEMIMKDWGGLSFAAGRLVLTEAKKATDVGQQIMREQWFSRVWERMTEEAVIVGEVDIEPSRFLAAPYAFTRHVWIPPKWEYALKPSEEVDADVTELDQNLATLEDKLSKRGYDLKEFVERKAREKKLLADAGITSSESELSTTIDEMNAYGVGVRAGSITPQPEDEDHFRSLSELPPMSAAARNYWSESHGIRKPVTLLPPVDGPSVDSEEDEVIEEEA